MAYGPGFDFCFWFLLWVRVQQKPVGKSWVRVRVSVNYASHLPTWWQCRFTRGDSLSRLSPRYWIRDTFEHRLVMTWEWDHPHLSSELSAVMGTQLVRLMNWQPSLPVGCHARGNRGGFEPRNPVCLLMSRSGIPSSPRGPSEAVRWEFLLFRHVHGPWSASESRRFGEFAGLTCWLTELCSLNQNRLLLLDTMLFGAVPSDLLQQLHAGLEDTAWLHDLNQQGTEAVVLSSPRNCKESAGGQGLLFGYLWVFCGLVSAAVYQAY